MRYLGVFGAGVLLALTSVVPASAQTPPPPGSPPPAPMLMPPPSSTWTGLYIGMSGGGGWGRSRQTATIGGGTSGTYRQTGGLVGGTVGFNWQLPNNFVLGVESDMSWTNIRGNVANPVCTGGNCFTNLDWLNTDRIRLGYAFSRIMPYITGGLSVGEIKGGQDACLGPPTICGIKTRVGWNAGGGLEAMIIPNLSVKAEYLHIDLGNQNLYTQAGVPVRVSERAEIVRVGLNYHFAAPPPPVVAAPAPPMPPPERKVFIVFFDWDKDRITPAGMSVIQQAAAAWTAGGRVQIQVTGYTDRSGSPGYNQRLSERRANNVSRALAGMGVPSSSMAVSGRGENDNRVPTADGVREPQNRRVEIVS